MTNREKFIETFGEDIIGTYIGCEGFHCLGYDHCAECKYYHFWQREYKEKRRKPTQECKCWSNYPNPARAKKCSQYVCVKERTLQRKTICRLKEENDGQM